MELKITEYGKNRYILDDGRVRCFLFVGERDALLIDAGFPDADVAGEVKKITSLPVRVALTHADMDHTGAVKEFGVCFVHPGDAHMLGEEIEVRELAEGDHIGAGDYDFEVIHIPGHTYGSVAFLDEKNGIAITGDSVQEKGPIFMFGKERNLSLYIDSLKKLVAMEDRLGTILPSHGAYPVGKEELRNCLSDALALAEGRITSSGRHEFMPCEIFYGEHVGFFYQP